MRNKSILVGMGVVVVLVLGLIIVNFQKKEADKNKSSQVATVKMSNEEKMKKEEEVMMQKSMAIMERAMNNSESKKAELTDVTGGNSIGKAFVLRKDNKLSFTASGSLPQPATGTFYEGWFVEKNTSNFISTGKLEKQKDGSYEVSYESDNLYPKYNFVVITLEKNDDQKPEKHILEGVLE